MLVSLLQVVDAWAVENTTTVKALQRLLLRACFVVKNYPVARMAATIIACDLVLLHARFLETYLNNEGRAILAANCRRFLCLQ